MDTSRVLTRRDFLLASAGVAAIVIAPTFASAPPAGATVDIYVVTSASLRLRSGPGLAYSILATLPAGTHVEVLTWDGTVDGHTWAQVYVSSLDKVGYVATTYLAPESSSGEFPIGSAVHVDTVSGGAANLRSSPAIANNVILLVANGTTGSVLSGETYASGYAWIRVSIAGSTGWMATAVLSAGSGTAQPQVKVADGPLNVRKAPGLSGTIITTVPTGATGQIVGDMPQTADGYVWVKVWFFNQANTTGWVAKNYLVWI
jgi:uncharacterized protein YgiM (DUF1202 family)